MLTWRDVAKALLVLITAHAILFALQRDAVEHATQVCAMDHWACDE